MDNIDKILVTICILVMVPALFLTFNIDGLFLIPVGCIVFAFLILLTGAKKILYEDSECPICKATLQVPYVIEKGEKVYRMKWADEMGQHFKDQHPNEWSPQDELVLESSIDALRNRDGFSTGEALEDLLSSSFFGGVEAETWGIKRQLQRQRGNEARIRVAKSAIHKLFIKAPKRVGEKLKVASLNETLESISNKCPHCGDMVPKTSRMCPFCNKSLISKEPMEDPLNILRVRYAKGEISETEYKKRKRTLEGS